MTTYYVDSSVSSSGDGYTSWSTAFKTLGEAVTAAAVAGDVIYISHQHNEQLGANATYTINSVHVPENPLKIFSVNKTNNGLSTGALIGHDSSARSILFTGALTAVYCYGITLKTAGSTAANITVADAARQVSVFNSCSFLVYNTAATSRVNAKMSAINRSAKTSFKKCEFTFSNASQAIGLAGVYVELTDCGISGTIDTLIEIASPPSKAVVAGCDISVCDYLIKVSSTSQIDLKVIQSKVKSGFSCFNSVSYYAGSAEIVDCSYGDYHNQYQYTDLYGTLSLDTGTYCNDNVSENINWKVYATAYATRYSPFVTPWISSYHSGTSAITPYLEILRSGSNTAFTDAEVWAEWSYKGTSGSTRAAIDDDGAEPLATPANQTASSKGAADWTGENATSWFGKLGPSSSITPAEAGDISFRICVGAPSTTVYVDPQIRGLG